MMNCAGVLKLEHFLSQPEAVIMSDALKIVPTSVMFYYCLVRFLVHQRLGQRWKKYRTRSFLVKFCPRNKISFCDLYFMLDKKGAPYL